MRNMKWLHIVSFILVIIGAVNWGLIGLFDFNLVTMLLGNWPAVERLVYVLVGLAGVWLAATHTKDCRTCSPGGMA